MTELRLTHLTYAGVGKPTARVDFDPRLTLIYGASDTGKSFIVDSIEYMLGGARLTLVPEAEGYSQILLGLLLPDGTPVTLVRTPGSNSVFVHLADLRDVVHETPAAVLTATHTARSTRSVSLYLLDQLGLAGTQIRTNESGRTRMLNMRDLVHLALVTETRTIDTVPPVLHSSRAAGQSAAKSVAKFVLTGEDEPIVAAGPNPVQRRVHRGKITLLNQLVLDLNTKLVTQENTTELQARRTRINTAIQERSAELHDVVELHATAVGDRTALTQELAVLQDRIGETRDLLGRFHLLRRQYESDLARLEMVSEAGNLLGYFHTGTCVFCGAEPQHQHPNHSQQETTQLHAAVEMESFKTRHLLSDLLVTIHDLETQLQPLREQESAMTARADGLDQDIAAAEQLVAPLRTRVDELYAARSEVDRELELHRRIEELDEVRAGLDTEDSRPTGRPLDHIPARVVSAFDEVLQHTLSTWNVPGVEYAGYDQYSGEVQAGGRARAGRGKGVRSVLHSAFTVALARFCIDRDLPHPGFLVLDSPVVTYREPVGGDIEITGSVVESFYRDLLAFPGQSIIVENGDPPQEVVAESHSYQFTGRSLGRTGFFPNEI
ncbi:hypothetical protein [Streptomyces sp. NPDC055134]